MGIGYLDVEVHTANGVLPVKGARVVVKSYEGKNIYEMITDANGHTKKVELSAPSKDHTFDPYDPGPYYSKYIVEVSADGYVTENINGVHIYDTETSILPVNMMPHDKWSGPEIDIIDIPDNSLHSSEERYQETSLISPRVFNEVFIPEYITVHLGTPSSTAQNVSVKFIDYIKNVASSEIYPTWPVAALEANIYCQISFVLNRVFTEWYRSRGFAFDITNSTAFDQHFVYGREIYASINAVVDRIFNQYIRRQGRQEPFFAMYCNGTTVTCDGLSQWGTVPLANSGLSPIQILKTYYPNDIQIVETNLIRGITDSYPGTALQQGSSGANVMKMQNYLNRIRVNYPLIPQISNPDGYFGSDTTNAVRAFQSSFYLVADGIIGKTTWNKIVSIYVGVKRLAELDSEGIHIGLGPTPPSVVLRVGSRGAEVAQLQFLLNFIASFYPTVSTVIENASFDSLTTTSVMSFQREFGLTPDGVVGPATWNKLYEIYALIRANVDIPSETEPSIPAFPGTSLRVGSRGSDVLMVQQCLNKIGNTYAQIPKLTEDGIFGNATSNAVIAFQRIFGLTQDGVVGPITWNRIMTVCYELGGTTPTPSPVYPGTPLRVGSRGSNVLIMQQYLNKIGGVYGTIPRLVTDGVFGENTRVAVVAFQRIFGLTVDGVIGSITWNKIVSVYNSIVSGSFVSQSSQNSGDQSMLSNLLGALLMSSMLSNR